MAVRGVGGLAAVAKTGLVEEFAEFAAEVELVRPIHPGGERGQFRDPGGEFQFDRPGEQDLVQSVVFQDRHDPARPHDLPHRLQRGDRVREAEQTLGAPGEVE